MTLALDASTAGDGSVYLSCTGASHVGTNKYASNFATTDSWAGGNTGALGHGSPNVAAATIGGTPVLQIGSVTPMLYSDQYVKRTVTGLTIGVAYRITALVKGASSASGSTTLVRAGIDGTAYSDPVAVTDVGSTAVNYDFVATATSHDVRLRVVGFDEGALPQSTLKLISVSVDQITAGLGPLQIIRTDANGTRFVRLPADAEPDNTGAFSVTDYEAALVGTVDYIVRDGLGFTATDSVTNVGEDYIGVVGALLGAVGLESLVGVPILRTYTDSRTYQQLTVDPKAVIGREDFTAVVTGDYGWTKRQGTLTLLIYGAGLSSDDCWSWAQLIAERYTEGRVMLLRQTTYTGMDLYHVGRTVRVEPAEVWANDAGDGQTKRQTWQVVVDYVETGWPEGDLVGTQWTYADLAEDYLAYWQLPATFATYSDLAAGL